MASRSACLAFVSIILSLLVPAAALAAPPDRVTYATQCAAEMGKIPAFNCLNGQLLDITVNGVSQSQLVNNCDKPVQLGLGGGSQCVPFSRLLALDTGKPNVTTIAICRKYFASSGSNDPRFDDIAMIQHNKATGRTCFFQSKLEANLDGRSVPSPSDNTAQANQYWLDSQSVSNIQCTSCHAADPFIWSSFVAQKADLAKWDPTGKYDSNFAGMFGGFSKVFQPSGNGCAVCHRFGRGPGGGDFSCNGLPTRYSGHLPNATHPSEFLMPPSFGGTSASWHSSFDAALAQIERCCANPDLAECHSRLADDEAPDDGSRFAAIWVRQSGPPFVARHGMTSQEYQQQFDQLVGQQGFCLVDVSGYAVGGQDRYAAIWEKKSCPQFVARHGMTSQQYQQQFDQLVGQQGFRLTLVDGYTVGGQDRYAAIWEKSPGPAFVARHGMTSQQYQQQFDQLVGQQGFCLTLVSGYSVGNQDRYAAIWEKKSCPAFAARHGMTSQQYQQAFDQLVGQQGFHLRLVSGHKINGQDSYAAIFEKSPSPAFVARHGMTSEAYQQAFDQLVGQQGFRLAWVSGY
jgi:hypothetical protein